VNRRRLQLVLVFGVASLLAAVGVAVATGGRDIRERLTGYEETPQALSTPANGEFKARVHRFSDKIDWRLSYRGFETAVTQAHIHFGARATSGGISVWLCKTTQTGPGADDAQMCPPQEGTLSGSITPEDVVGPAGQGIGPAEWEEFEDALEAGVTYANVHSTARPPGEIRAQLNEDDDDRRW
jgi:CHRD domain